MREGDQVQCLDERTGKVIWSSPELPGGGPGVALGALTILATDDGHATALNRATGTIAWHRDLEGSAAAPPIACGNVFVAIYRILGVNEGGTSHIYGLDPATGASVWEKTLTHQEVFFPPECGAGLLFLASAGTGQRFGQLAAWEPNTGRERWSQPISTDVENDYTPRLAGSNVLVWAGDPVTFQSESVSMFYRLMAYDAQTGDLRWAYKPAPEGAERFSRPVLVGGQVIYSEGETLVGLSPPSAK